MIALSRIVLTVLWVARRCQWLQVRAVGCVPGGSRIDMNVFLLLGLERGIKCAQCYRNPVGKVALGT